MVGGGGGHSQRYHGHPSRRVLSVWPGRRSKGGVCESLASLAHTTPSQPTKNKASRALQSVLQKCVHLPALEAILNEAPPAILENVVGQFAKVLPNDPKARKLFVTSGGLKKVQEIKAEPGSQLEESIGVINSAFPAEIVKYYSPGIEASLLERLDQYEPTTATAVP
eukprot:m.21447 g.21447  ORF g.21447 m.21447 type:complete len:167 (-) comp3897_c0_seq1:338-838(-)